MINNQYVKLFFAASLITVSACSPKVENRGYVSQEDWKDSIKVGQSSKQDVLEKLGSPSAQSSFGSEIWYYISSHKESIAFLKPEIVSQDSIKITFDNSGIISDIKNYDVKDGKEIELVKRETPTEGHSLSFIDQTLGNLGRFNKPSDGSTAAPGRRPGRGGGF